MGSECRFGRLIYLASSDNSAGEPELGGSRLRRCRRGARVVSQLLFLYFSASTDTVTSFQLQMMFQRRPPHASYIYWERYFLYASRDRRQTRHGRIGKVEVNKASIYNSTIRTQRNRHKSNQRKPNASNQITKATQSTDIHRTPSQNPPNPSTYPPTQLNSPSPLVSKSMNAPSECSSN